MVDLFQANPEVLEHYQDRFRYIMVDEYQDTNTVPVSYTHLDVYKRQVQGQDFKTAVKRAVTFLDKAIAYTAQMGLPWNYGICFEEYLEEI